VQRVGSSCRVCAHGDCPARREPSILAAEGVG
jgi:predicted transcriptional regulator